MNGDLRVLSAVDVRDLLAGHEREVIEVVTRAYLAHTAGDTVVPHSQFLSLPGDPRNRIIALPAYVGDGIDAAGVKWIASIPGNLEVGYPRASAVLLLNEIATGRPRAVLEASQISAWRTAASAALAASRMTPPGASVRVGLIGCGPINAAVLGFLRVMLPIANELVIHDLDGARADEFDGRFADETAGLGVRIASSVDAVVAACSVVSFATTAATPYVHELSGCAPGTTILHVSLRDLAPELMATSDNVVDDLDHVCRARTSIHLAEQLVGHREFVRCTVGDILRGTQPGRRSLDGVAIFSPFGLGVLDVAVGALVLARAEREGCGRVIERFLDG